MTEVSGKCVIGIFSVAGTATVGRIHVFEVQM